MVLFVCFFGFLLFVGAGRGEGELQIWFAGVCLVCVVVCLFLCLFVSLFADPARISEVRSLQGYCMDGWQAMVWMLGLAWLLACLLRLQGQHIALLIIQAW